MVSVLRVFSSFLVAGAMPLASSAMRRAIVWLLLALSAVSHAESVPELIINGGATALRDNVRQYLSIASEGCKAPLWRLKSLIGDAQDEIEQAAQALGYYQLTFETKLTQKNDCWQLQIQLKPGEQTRINSFRLVINGDGFRDDIFKSLYERPPIKVGDRLNHGTYENLKNRLSTLAASHGYFDARFEVARIVVNSSENTAEIDLVYDTGVRYRIGEIRITHAILDENFLRRFVNFSSGDYYDTDKLLELKSLYNATNYFNVATASPDLQNMRDHQVPVDIVLEERKRHDYSIGAGVATDTGARVLLGYEDRYVNSRGHKVKADFSTSNIKTTAQLAYTIPLSRPSYEFFKVYTGFEDEVTDTSTSRKNTVGSSYAIYRDNQWLQTYAINVENEASALTGESIKNTHLLIPSLTLSRTQTDGNPYPLSGWSAMAKISGSPKVLGSDVSYIQFYSRAKYIHEMPVGRVLLRSEFGATQVNDFGELPTSVRYFAGGDNSVRGYDYKSLGPMNSEDKVIGGNNLIVNSIEYDYRFRPSWAIAAFYDVGNAADDFKLRFKSGAGLGVRWISPIGPVRVDVARGLNAPNEWRLHVTMGPDL